MTEKSKVVLSLGVALASLTGMSVQGAEAKAVGADDRTSVEAEILGNKPKPNAYYQGGKIFLGS